MTNCPHCTNEEDWVLFRSFIHLAWRNERGAPLAARPLAPMGEPLGRPRIIEDPSGGQRYDDELCNFIEADVFRRPELRWGIRPWGSAEDPRPVTPAQLIFLDGGLAPVLRGLVDGSADAVTFDHRALPDLRGAFELLIAADDEAREEPEDDDLTIEGPDFLWHRK